MGKSHLSSTRVQEFVRVTSHKLQNPRHAKPVSKIRFSSPQIAKSGVESEQLKFQMENQESRNRMPLSEVVSNCVKRWFHDTLKEAKAGDSSMQILVGQMYYSGYGVPKDAQKGKAWMTRASKSRSSVWNVRDKHPGYNASDSDSDELKEDVK